MSPLGTIPLGYGAHPYAGDGCPMSFVNSPGWSSDP